jgi:hypothetical protein
MADNRAEIVLDQELEKRIMNLAYTTQEQIAMLLGDWLEYFKRLGIDEAKQDAEFTGILLSRFRESVVSIAAPLNELGRITNG